MTGEQVLRWPELMLSYRRFLHERAPDRVIHTNWHHLLLLVPFLRPDRDIYWAHEVYLDKPQYGEENSGGPGIAPVIHRESLAILKRLHELQ